MYVDVVSACNLRCPSCAVGNSGPVTGMTRMSMETFEKIIQKGKRDYNAVGVGLYNWTEPLLHPDLAQFIHFVKKQKLLCTLSTNLNIIRNIEDILMAEPDSIRISLSGFSQEIYGQTHARGNIETVKENMQALSEAKKKTKNRKTVIYVYYHKYRHNLEELNTMKAYAKSLGFDWLEDWAYYTPLERVLELAENKLSDDRQRFVDQQFALPISQAIEAAKPFKNERCNILDDQLVIDAAGNLNLCCATYEPETGRLGKFLEMSKEEIGKAKSGHPTCGRCAAHGLHAYFSYMNHPVLRGKYDKLAKENLAQPLVPRTPIQEIKTPPEVNSAVSLIK